MINGALAPELAIANGEDAGAEERRDEEVERGECEECIEEGVEVVGEVGEMEEVREGLGDTAEEGGEWEGHGGGDRDGLGDIHGAVF